MDLTPDLEMLAQGALVLFVLGFMTRDELRLRSLVTMGCVLLITFNGLNPAGPLWTPIIHNGVMGSINIVLLVTVIRERSTIGMGRQTLNTYRIFTTCSPGQFRKLIQLSTIQRYGTETRLCTAGEVPEVLVLVLGGEARLERDGGTYRIGAGNFVGEISFLLGGPATATVTAMPGSRCMVWQRDKLNRLLSRSPSLSNALGALLNRDLARKVSASAPIMATAS